MWLPWSLLLWPLLISDIPSLYQMSQEMLPDVTSHLLMPSPRGAGTPGLQVSFSRSELQWASLSKGRLSKTQFSCPLTASGTGMSNSVVPSWLLGSFSVGITPWRTLSAVLRAEIWALSFVQRRSQPAVMPSLVYSWGWSVSMEWASWDLILQSGSLLTLELSLQGKTLVSCHAFCFGRQRVTAVT